MTDLVKLVEIVMTGHGRGTVKIDGSEIVVRRIAFAAGVDELNTVTLTFAAEKVSISGPAAVIDVAGVSPDLWEKLPAILAETNRRILDELKP